MRKGFDIILNEARQREFFALADHVEMEHERELAPGTTIDQIRDMHDKMHSIDTDGTQYGHTHPKFGTP